MIHTLATGSILVVGFALALGAERRGWAPSARAALITGFVLRVTLVLLASRDPSQPYDFANDFRLTAQNILTGHDPVLNIREGGWHFLPLAAYLFAAAMRLGQIFDVPWRVAGRLVPMLADLALIPLVGRLAPERAALRRFQYACAPLALMVSSIHGQIEPIALAFGVAALLAAQRHRPAAAGLLLGLSITVGSWPVLLAPGVLLALRSARGRFIAFGWGVAVPAVFFLSTPLVVGEQPKWLVPAAKQLLSTRPVVGDWGWSPWFTGGQEVLSSPIAHAGMILLLAALAGAGYLWRRADPVDLTAALLMAFLLVTARFGTQYLLWVMPYLISRPTRATLPAAAAMSAWAAAGYLHFLQLHGYTWSELHAWWAFSSDVVIVFMAFALPWSRRGRPASILDIAAQRPAVDRGA
ncbi:MAG TPA: glycosyltransferase 87 family protein [Actinoallomurus sp.]